MNDKINVKVTDAQIGKVSQHDLETSFLSVICHQGGLEVEATDDDVFTITAVDTVQFAETMPQEEWESLRVVPRFIELFKHVFNFDPPPKLVTTDTKHVVGMICLVAHAMSQGKRPFLKLPETHLHPRHVVNIPDMLVMMGKGK